jgi:DNA adenine methylase
MLGPGSRRRNTEEETRLNRSPDKSAESDNRFYIGEQNAKMLNSAQSEDISATMPASAAALRAVRPLFQEDIGPTRVKPFLKWAGGKTRLLPALRKSSPQRFNRYFEPFLGGGAFFFDSLPSDAVLGDSNPELINCYQVVREKPRELIAYLSKLRINEAEFYRLRELRPEELAPVVRAARLIYLNKTCYNGLYRVNRQGRFNTPYGRHSNVTLVDPNNLIAASVALRRAQLICADFASVLETARKGDFVYLDPPYVPVGKFSDFKRYTKDQFYEADQERLATRFRELSAKGCSVLLSNSFNEKTAKLYSRFFQRTVKMPRFVNCKGEGRGHVDELLISNYEPK